MNNFKGKVAVITGGGGGIAYGIGYACAKEGMNLVLSDIAKDRLESNAKKLKEETGAKVATIITDVTKFEDIEKLANFTMKTYGRVDAMFNNAGVHFHKAFQLLTLKDWDWMIKTNLWSVIYGMKVFIPLIENNEDGGYVVNTSSGAGGFGIPSMSHYCTVKHAIKGLTEAVILEHKNKGSKVNLLVFMPSFIISNLMNSAAEIRPDEYRNEEEKQTELDKAYEEKFLAATGEGGVEDRPGTLSNITAGEMILQAMKDEKNYLLPQNIPERVIQNAEKMSSGYLVG
jgi:NAD(P)-dependent dehydrogenase (short-subunit alcohol dehydrogenase family)